MKILLVSQYFPPESTTLVASIAEHLSHSGHDVQVLTGFPNYPAGKIFPGYKQSWRAREEYKGIPILRVPLYTSHSSNPVARMANYISFALSSATAFITARNFDVIYVYATQMTPAFGPWIWRKFGGPSYVLHVQDLWPDSIVGSSLIHNPRVKRIVDLTLTPWIKNVYQNAQAIIGIAPTMVDTLIARGASKENSKLVYNWSSDSSNRLSLDHDIDPDGITNIIFAGNIGDMQDLETVVHAAKMVEDHPIKITIVGDGVALPKIESLAREIDATNVQFEGRVHREEMAEFYQHAHFALVTLKDLPAFRGTIPSKFQASLAHGLPIITTVQGDLRKIVQDFEIGFVANSQDPESLAAALLDAANLMSKDYEKISQKASETYVAHFSKDSALVAIEKILKDGVG